jgi:hypothetical protein
LVTEDALLSWIAARELEKEKEEGKPLSSRLKLFIQPQVQSFVDWIKEDEEESDDDDEEQD